MQMLLSTAWEMAEDLNGKQLSEFMESPLNFDSEYMVFVTSKDKEQASWFAFSGRNDCIYSPHNSMLLTQLTDGLPRSVIYNFINTLTRSESFEFKLLKAKVVIDYPSVLIKPLSKDYEPAAYSINFPSW